MMDSKPIYLDYNATTPLLPSVVEAMLPFLRDHFGNPSSAHAHGQRARSAIARAREQVAAFLGCDSDEVLFTSGGTEANNLAIRGLFETPQQRDHVLTSVIEHPATARPCSWLEARGVSVTKAPVDRQGVVMTEVARAAIGERTALVTVMHSNNETGVLQPIAELAKLARAQGAYVHSDAAQSLGKVPINVRALDVDLLSLAGHKLYAPKGVGALYVRRGVPLAPVLLGAGHERGLRPGTENVASIVGLGEACDILRRDMQHESARILALREELWSRLRSLIPEIALNGHPELRLPNTLNVLLPRTSAAAVLAGTPDVAASTGSACHDGAERASPVIVAMGVSPETALGSLRLTLGRGTTLDDLTRAADALFTSWSRTVTASRS